MLAQRVVASRFVAKRPEVPRPTKASGPTASPKQSTGAVRSQAELPGPQATRAPYVSLTTKQIPEEELIALREEIRRHGQEEMVAATTRPAPLNDDSHVVASTVRATQPPQAREPARASAIPAPITPIASPLADSVDFPDEAKGTPPIKTLVSAQEDPAVAEVISRAHAARSTQAPAIKLEGIRVPESNPPPTLPALDPAQQPSIPPMAAISAPPPVAPGISVPPAPTFGSRPAAPVFGAPPKVIPGSTAPFSPAPPVDAAGHKLMITVSVLSFMVVLGLGLTIFLLLRPKPDPSKIVPLSTSASASTEAASAKSAQPPLPANTAKSASEKPAASSAADPQSPEGQARQALEKLRTGIDTCVREHIHVLPGTSPPVPQSIALLQSGPYQSVARNWWTPVWSCASFQWEAPQAFQIQWQMLKLNHEGQGVAYLDDDRDGKPDRAFGFRAKVVLAGQVELGPIEVLDPIPPLAKWIP